MKCTACTTHTTQILSNCTKNPIIVLKLDQLQDNSHLELNLKCTYPRNKCKSKNGLVCRLCISVRIEQIFLSLPFIQNPNKIHMLIEMVNLFITTSR